MEGWRQPPVALYRRGAGSPPHHHPSTYPLPPTLHRECIQRLTMHSFQPHASLALTTPFSTTLGHALGPRTGAAHGGPQPRTEFCSRDASFAVARMATPSILCYGPERGGDPRAVVQKSHLRISPSQCPTTPTAEPVTTRARVNRLSILDQFALDATTDQPPTPPE